MHTHLAMNSDKFGNPPSTPLTRAIHRTDMIPGQRSSELGFRRRAWPESWELVASPKTRLMQLSRAKAHQCSALKLGWIALVLFLALSAHAAITPQPAAAPESSHLTALNSHDRDLQFAQDQIRQFESLLGDLSERAEDEADIQTIARMKTALTGLDAQIQLANSNLAQARKQHDPFTREKLRSSILSLQDSGRRALGIMIENDTNKNSGEGKAVAGI